MVFIVAVLLEDTDSTLDEYIGPVAPVAPVAPVTPFILPINTQPNPVVPATAVGMVTEPLEVHVYTLYPPAVVMVGLPVVADAAA